MQDIYWRIAVRQYWITLVTSRASRRRCWGHLLINTSWSKPWPGVNMLPNMNKCVSRWSILSASLRVVALKLLELTLFALPKRWYSSIPCVQLRRGWRHHQSPFSLSSTCVLLPYAANTEFFSRLSAGLCTLSKAGWVISRRPHGITGN